MLNQNKNHIFVGMSKKSNLNNLGVLKNEGVNNKRHPKCRGYVIPDPGHGWGDDFGCDYETTIDCDECKYGGGYKDPEAKCNQE